MADAAAAASTPERAWTLGDRLELEIRTKPSEPPILITASAGETVLQLKQRLANGREGWAVAGMNLIRQGRFLDDVALLGDCGLRSGEFVVLTGQLPVIIQPPPDLDPDTDNPLLAPLMSSTRAPPEATAIQRD